MKTIVKLLAALVLIGAIGKACKDNPQSTVEGSDSSAANGRSENAAGVNTTTEYVLDASSASSCSNYLKGKTYTGGSARLKFGYDGTVSAYDSGGQLVFGGTLEIGPAMSDVSRWIYVRDMSGGGKLEFLLSADGKMMEKSSLVIYKPE